MLKTRFIRDAKNRVCGTATSGYQDGSESVRNRSGALIGHVLTRQNINKDMSNRIVSHTADSGFFFGYSEDADDQDRSRDSGS
jgi:hypothetical protein